MREDVKRACMTSPVRLFVETVYHPAFRFGGWGLVRAAGAVLSGAAGGERSMTAARIDLMDLIAALDGLAAGEAVVVQSANPGVIGAARRLAAPPPAGSEDAPTDDLDLWARALTAVQGRALTVKAAVREPRTPAAFCFAWAEVGRDKAKMNAQGKFSAAIPKVNLATLTLG